MTTELQITRPDFHSDSCFTILGCGKSGSPEELRIAYRDLSRKVRQTLTKDDASVGTNPCLIHFVCCPFLVPP